MLTFQYRFIANICKPNLKIDVGQSAIHNCVFFHMVLIFNTISSFKFIGKLSVLYLKKAVKSACYFSLYF